VGRDQADTLKKQPSQRYGDCRKKVIIHVEKYLLFKGKAWWSWHAFLPPNKRPSPILFRKNPAPRKYRWEKETAPSWKKGYSSLTGKWRQFALSDLKKRPTWEENTKVGGKTTSSSRAESASSHRRGGEKRMEVHHVHRGSSGGLPTKSQKKKERTTNTKRKKRKTPKKKKKSKKKKKKKNPKKKKKKKSPYPEPKKKLIPRREVGG